MTGRILAAVVGVILAYAGANKVTGRREWKESVRGQGLPAPVAFLVPPAELVLGACLVALPLNPFVLGLSTFLLLVFTVFLAAQVAGRSQSPCACFGSRSTRPPAWRDVARNIAMIAALFAAAVTA